MAVVCEEKELIENAIIQLYLWSDKKSMVLLSLVAFLHLMTWWWLVQLELVIKLTSNENCRL